MTINVIREKVKKFLKETLEDIENSEEIRVIGIEATDNSWTAEAEVIEKNLMLPEYRVFEKKHYLVKLNSDLEVSSYKQVKSKTEEEEV